MTYSSLESNSGQQNIPPDINLETVPAWDISDSNHMSVNDHCHAIISDSTHGAVMAGVEWNLRHDL